MWGWRRAPVKNIGNLFLDEISVRFAAYFLRCLTITSYSENSNFFTNLCEQSLLTNYIRVILSNLKYTAYFCV
jgi:hypothetical protein